MASVFQTNSITQAGLRLIAESSSANPIAFVDALSASQIPQDPEDAQGYHGIGGTIDASSATDATARVVALFGNTSTSEAQVVKAIAIRAKLASQSDSDAVIFAYSYDADSAIHFPSNTAPSQRTRFAFAFDFSQTQNVSVTEAGSASLADLERFVSCHKAGNPNAGEDQTIFGDKYWYGQQDFDEACRFYNAVVTHSVGPETDNKYSLGLQKSRYNAIYGETVNSSIVMANSVSAGDARVGSLHVSVQNDEPVVDLSGSTLTGWKSGYGTSDNPYQYNLLIGGGGLTETDGDDYGVLTITPQAVHVDAPTGNVTYPYVEVKVGTTAYPLKSVCTQELILRSTANASSAIIMYGEGGIMMHADIMPAHDTRATAEDCGRFQRPWNHVYVRDAVTFVGDSSSEAQCITLYDDEGTLVLSPGHDIRLGTTWGAHGSIYGAPMGVSSLRHTPSELPNSSEVTDAPTWDIEKGAIVMAMPCWATARSVFMRRKGAGDSIDVTFPDVAQAPFQHVVSYDNDPEKGAWYIASWRYGYGNIPQSHFIPLSTQDGSTNKELFSYLPAGKYRLLNAVEECGSVEYSDYHPEGMCVLLQKIS